jgi:preprotein translocase subunit YajC
MPADWTTLIGSWLPFVVLILVWVFLSQRLRGTNVEQIKKYYEEMQRMNALLDRIAVALERRAGTSA